MKYIIERAVANNPRSGWVRSDTYPNTYTYKQAKGIIDADMSVVYRMTPVERTPWGYLPRTVTREEFLDILVDAAKERISFDTIHKYLPFAILKRSGNTYNHIVNDSVYPVQTEKRTVREGETLCGRFGRLYPESMQDACPGCLAIARGLAVRDLV